MEVRQKSPKGHVKCCVCGKYVPKDEKITVSGKNYCKVCGTPVLKDAEDFKKVNEYLYVNLGIKEWANMVLINAYLKKLKENYGLSNSQIYFTLMYMYEFEDPPADPIEKETDVFSVIRHFQEAKKFWREYKAIKVPGPDELEKILTAPPVPVVINRSEIIRKEEEDAKKRAKRNHREEIDGDDIIDDGIINTDFDYLNYNNKYHKDFDNQNQSFYNKEKWED